MSISGILLLILLCACASIVQRVCGFGFGIFIMTMLPYLCPSFGEATTLSGLLAASQSLYVLLHMWRYVNWKHLILILLSFSVFSFFAVQFVAETSEGHLKMLLGIILILLSLYFFFISPHMRVKPTSTLQVSMGALSGVMGGLFGMHGPPAVIYFLASEPSKIRYMAICQAFFLLSNIMVTIFRIRKGFLTEFVEWGWLTACIGVVIGSYIGKKIFDKISNETMRKLIYIYLFISGVITLVL